MAQPKLLKVWSFDRTIRKAVSSTNFAELKEKCKTKFNLNDNEMTTVRFVLNEDGTEVDEEYYEALQTPTVVLLLRQNEIWAPDSEEKRLNFFRQLLLCQDLGTKAVRILFDLKVPNLHAHLACHKTNLMTSQWKCTAPQLALLFPVKKPTVVKTADFDFSLLYKLIRNTVKITAPVQGWGNDPTPADTTMADDIERIRYYRNKISHNTEFQIDHSLFNSQWADLSQAIERLSSGTLKNDIAALRNRSLDSTSMKSIFEELKRDLRDVVKRVDDVENYTTSTVRKVEDISKPIPQNVREQHTQTIERWRTDDLVYYETTYYKLVYDTMKEQKHLTLIGGPGIGKTATVRHLALQLEKEGYCIVPILELRDIIQYGQVNTKQVFLIDDIFGVFGLQMDKYNKANDYKEQIFNLLGDKSKMLITCRKSVYKEVLKYESFITKSASVVDLEGEEIKLTDDNKKSILAKHCVNSDIQKELYEQICFNYPTVMFPLLCKLFSNDTTYHKLGESFFRNPYKHILQEITKLQMYNALHYASLVMCALNQNKLSGELLDGESSEIADLKTDILKTCRVESSTDNWKIIDALSREEGTYTTKLKSEFSLIHDFIFEVISCHYGRQHPVYLLKYMSSSFICDRVIVSKQGLNSDDDLVIHLEEEHFHALAARLYKDLRDMNLHDVFMNKCMYDERVCKCFIQVLNSKSYEEIKFMILRKREIEETFMPKTRSGSETFNVTDSFFELEKQSLLLDRDKLRWFSKGMNYKTVLRAVSWVVMYGHTKILQYIIDRVTNSKESTDEVFGSDIQEQTRLLILGCYSNEVDLLQLIIQHVRPECLDSTPRYYTPLTAACRSGFLGIVTKLIESQCDINKANVYGSTPLTTACKSGHRDVVIKLIESRCDINKADKHKFTPITAACRSGFLNIVIKLVEYHCDIHTTDRGGRTPLWCASLSGHIPIVKYLIGHKVDINKCVFSNISSLYIASKYGHFDVVRLLLENGADVNLCDKDNMSPLYAHVASGCMHCDVVSLLISHGADVNQCDKDNKSPLYAHVASDVADVDMINLLISHGADVNQCDKDNKSPLYAHVASDEVDVDVISLLISHGADVNQCDNDNKSPLYVHVASDVPNAEVISLLISHGADVNQCDNDNKSPLYVRVASDVPNAEVISLLISHGADVNQCDKDNKSPLYVHVASRWTCYDVIRLLISHGADVNQCDKDNKSPLYAHVASDKANVEVISLLISHGADINLCDKDNKSPLYAHVASNVARLEIVHLLVLYRADLMSLLAHHDDSKLLFLLDDSLFYA